MLKGKNVVLRPVRESDLPFLVERNAEFEHRGKWYPHHYFSEPTVRKEFEKDGFWSDAHGMLFMTDPESGDILGEIHYFKTVRYLSELEIAYRTYDPSSRRKGITSESVRILHPLPVRVDGRAPHTALHRHRQRSLARCCGEGRLQARGHAAERLDQQRPSLRHGAVRDNDRRRPRLAMQTFRRSP